MALRIRVLLALLSGVLYFCGFVGYDQFYLSWICLVPLFVALRGTTPGRAVALGWLMGLTTHMGVYWWVVGLLQDFGGFGPGGAFAGYVALCAYQGGFFAVFAWILVRLERAGVDGIVWLAPVVHTGLEAGYPFLFRSFLANSQIHFVPFLQVAELVGPAGMGFVMVLVNSVLAASILRLRDRRPLPRTAWATATAVVVASLAYGTVRIEQIDARVAGAPSLRVGVVQANLGAAEKRGNAVDWIGRHREMTLELVRAAPDLDLVVWPETAYPRLLPPPGETVRGTLQVDHAVPMLAGVLRYEWADVDAEPEVFNSVALVDTAGDVRGTYDKNRLLAFGEYMPLAGWFPALRELSPNTGDFTPGRDRDPLRLDGVTVGVTICYEDILPGFVRGVMRGEDGSAPHLLVNLSNDSWFGETIEPEIHLALAAFRAVEHRRALVRSTSTGVSALVDPVGRIGPRLPPFEAATMVMDVPMLTGGTVYGAIGDLPAWGCLVATALLLLAAALGRLRPPPSPAGVRGRGHGPGRDAPELGTAEPAVAP